MDYRKDDTEIPEYLIKNYANKIDSMLDVDNECSEM